jgi:CRP/FNR family transcriptional regulator, polysaccharide utilization system transcription regulator
MKKILLIEDNLEVRENTAEILELSGYHVVTAENGKIGVRLAKQEIPDLIICDIMMPELDGYGVLRILNQSPETATIPFIFLTAKAEKSDFRKGMNLGADDYLTKPFEDVELMEVIEMRLKKSEQLNKTFENNEQGLRTFINEARGSQELEALSEDRETRHYRKKDFIFHEEGYPKQVYFINKGKIKICKTNDDGREFIVSLHGQGDFIGYLAMLQNTTYQESAIALEDTEVSIIPKDDFFTLLHNNRDVANRFIKLLASNVIEQEKRLLELAYNSVRKRVADALLRLQERYKEEDKKYFTMAIPRDDLASMVGTAKETVIRTLSDFKAEGLIEIHGSKITIKKTEELENMLN